MEGFFIDILNRSITASYLIVAIVLVRLLLHKAPKWIRGIFWGLVGIRLVIPFSFESMFSLIPDSSPIGVGNIEKLIPGTNANMSIEIPRFNVGGHATLQNQGTAATGLVTESAVQSGDISWFAILAIIWLVGLVAMLVYALGSYIRLKNHVLDAVIYRGGKPEIYQSEKVASPFVSGLLFPRIYVPFKMDLSDMDYVIAHEKAHIARRDHWIKPIGFVILAVYWFNPSVWLAYILLCRDIELACDEKVIKEMSVPDKKAYSKALMKCSVPGRMISACPLAFGEIDVKKRIVNVLNYKKPGFWIVLVSIVFCVVVAVCFLTNPKGQNEQKSTLSKQHQKEEILSEQPLQEETLNKHQLQEEKEWVAQQTNHKFLTSPPTMTLQNSLSGNMNLFYVQSGTYSWNYLSENPNEMIGVEAEGMFPTMAVKGQEWLRVKHYNGIDVTSYLASFEVSPNRVTIKEYDLLELGDMEPDLLAETVKEEVYFLELQPRRIYELIAEWDQENLETNGFYGSASYIFATDNYAVNVTEKEDVVTIQAHIKETMPDTTDRICISSNTDSFPGAFIVIVPTEVYDKDKLQGGQTIYISMWDTGEVENGNLPIYEATEIVTGGSQPMQRVDDLTKPY